MKKELLVEIAPAFKIDLSDCKEFKKRQGYMPEIMFYYNNGTIFTQQYTQEKQRDDYFNKINLALKG
jgi:hypothetical protein